MASESRSGSIAKVVQKHAGRAKEKFLQNLGKVDRTADEIFDEHLHNFTRQQNAANRIQKEFTNYIRCVRAAQVASKSLLEAIGETYESQWTGHDSLYSHIQSIDMLWQDCCHKLADQVMIPLNTYQGQFIEMRKKIDKRGRKLVDYDSQRHAFQSLQTNMKKRDDGKIAKGREQMEEAKRTYELLNSELHDELPALYDSRILFFVSNLQSMFNAEHVFHSETAKIYGDLDGLVDKLAMDSQRGSYTVKKSNGSSLPRTLNNKSPTPMIMNNINSLHSVGHTTPKSEPTTPTESSSSPSKKSNSDNSNTMEESPSASPSGVAAVVAVSTADALNNNKTGSASEIAIKTPPSPMAKSPDSPTVKKSPQINGSAISTIDGTPKSAAAANNTDTNDSNSTPTNNSSNKKLQDGYDLPAHATTIDLPPGVLYRVKATYKYAQEDMDELSFEAGDIINVVEYDNPEDQEEGWLMGFKEATKQKGMFPANFTRPI